MLSPPVNRRRLPQRDELLAPYNLGYRIKLLSQLLSRQLQERLRQLLEQAIANLS
jgi:hypothetical protein